MPGVVKYQGYIYVQEHLHSERLVVTLRLKKRVVLYTNFQASFPPTQNRKINNFFLSSPEGVP